MPSKSRIYCANYSYLVAIKSHANTFWITWNYTVYFTMQSAWTNWRHTELSSIWSSAKQYKQDFNRSKIMVHYISQVNVLKAELRDNGKFLLQDGMPTARYLRTQPSSIMSSNVFGISKHKDFCQMRVLGSVLVSIKCPGIWIFALLVTDILTFCWRTMNWYTVNPHV